ncbi:MAG: hypothetical protein CFE39_10660, partial [Comamonadaceae bacterium PBBC2]
KRGHDTQLQKIAFEVVRIAKPLETRIQLRFALLCCEIYRTLVKPSVKQTIQHVGSAGAAPESIAD